MNASQEDRMIIDCAETYLKKMQRANLLSKREVDYQLSGIMRGKHIARQIIPYVRNRNLDILDFGSGSGLVSLGLAKIFDGSITGIEIDKRYLEMAKAWLKISSMKNISFEYKKIEKLIKRYDIIIANATLEHVPDRLHYLNLFRKNLKQGGLLYLKTTNRVCLYSFIRDPHFNIPFISVLSRSLRNKIAFLCLKKRTPITFDYSYKWELETLFKESGFKIVKDFRPFNYFFMTHEYLID